MDLGPRRKTLIAANAIALTLALTSMTFCVWCGIVYTQWPWPLIIFSLFWIIWPVAITRRELRSAKGTQSGNVSKRKCRKSGRA
jgi:hypothetical protein